VTSVRWCTQQNVKTTAKTTALSPRGRPRYPLQLRVSSHCLLCNSKEPHFLLFYQWEWGLLVRSHGTAQASGRRYQKNFTIRLYRFVCCKDRRLHFHIRIARYLL